MKLRLIAYFLTLIFSIISTVALYQAYKAGVDPVTIPAIGVFLLPTSHLPILLIEASIIIPWTLVNITGTALNAEWLNPSRLWLTIIAVIQLIIVQWFFTLNPSPLPTLVVSHPALAYCLAEGVTTVIERRKY